MLFCFFLLLLRFTYVLGYINGWQSYNTRKFPQGGVNYYRKSHLPSCLETARWDSLRGFLLLPVHGDVSMYFCWESMGERHQSTFAAFLDTLGSGGTDQNGQKDIILFIYYTYIHTQGAICRWGWWGLSPPLVYTSYPLLNYFYPRWG